MTNEDIDRLMFMLDNKVKDFEGLKELLLQEKKKNYELIRQSTVEEYLNNPGYNKPTYLSYNDDKMIFTNGISLYILKSKFFKVDNKKFRLVDFNRINEYIIKFEKLYGKTDEHCELWGEPIDIVESEFVHMGTLYRDHYNENEIDICNRIFNYLEYRNSVSNPILKVESEIGKAYILGHKRCQE